MKKNNYEIFSIDKIVAYFLVLLPICLISGPFLSDLSISILAVSSFFYLKKKIFYKLFFYFFYIILDFYFNKFILRRV